VCGVEISVRRMSWNLLNVPLSNRLEVLLGKNRDAPEIEAINKILNDGWEPFSTAVLPAGDWLVSFRQYVEDETVSTTLEHYEMPGYL
jgi:hypothetical protein